MFRFVLCVCVWWCLAAVAVGRRSPNAAMVEEFLASQSQGSRYSSNIIEDALLDAPGLVRKYGYPIEIHHVTTSDGYVLELHRIPHGRDRNNEPGLQRPAILVMHGLLSSSADFLVLGPGNALGYLLAEEGYDVWLGNARGNYYSRRHTTLNPDDENQDFWRFSWEQIGIFDLAATTDYIIATTGQPRIQYIGHSQGGTAFLVLNSMRPEYNSRFISFQALAPGAFFKYNPNPIYGLLAPYEMLLEPLAFRLGFAEVLPNSPFFTIFGVAACTEASLFQPLCAGVIDLVLSDTLNTTMTPIFLGHAPAGASIRQITHYAQTIRRQSFARYNFDPVTNFILYGQFSPPEFDLSRVTVPAYLHYGLADNSAYWKDIHLLAKRLGNTVGLFRAERDDFNHYDFIWGPNIKEELYDQLIDLMRQAEINRN